MSLSFANQVMAQIELWVDAQTGANQYPVGVYVLPNISTRRSRACS